MADLRHGDCLEVLRTLPACSVDAVVTDPPYGLAFMGKRWDYDVPSVETWAECLRVLKPGGHLLAFAGTRTQHRMAVRIEDAGFEIRDLIMWCYGSGFPKSLDVSKAIDRAAGAEREVGPVDPARAGRLVNQREDYATDAGWSAGGRKVTIDPPATPEAQQWAGWGTALKPALEPITMARKPLEGTVAANVLAHGTGGLNVDGCRVEGAIGSSYQTTGNGSVGSGGVYEGGYRGEWSNPNPHPESVRHNASGRWPANLIHDGSDEVVGLFPQQQSGANPTRRGGMGYHGAQGQDSCDAPRGADTGSAARFFYTSKASRDDRDHGNTHPTVKPTDLMRYLCRLVTPPGGMVLDPFMGSGSTGKAALLEGFGFIGIEREAQYFAIAQQRIGRAAAAGYQPSLLEAVA